MICSSRTETRYLALRGRLDMEFFIRQTLSCLLCAGFIIALAMFGRQYLCLVSCAATCLLFQQEMGPGSGDLSSSQRLLDKEPNIPLCAREIRAARDRENVKKSHCNYLPILSLPLGLDILYREGYILAKRKRQHTSLCFQMK